MVYSPSLVQRILPTNIASVDSFQEQFARKAFGLGQVTYDKIRFSPTVFTNFTDTFHQSFQTQNLYEMNMRWLIDFVAKTDSIRSRKAVVNPANTGREEILDEGGLEVENFFFWCWDILTLATTRALYSDYDPFVQNKILIEHI